MHPDTGDPPWWVWLIVGVLVGGFILNALRIIIRDRRHGNRNDPLPRLDPIPRSAIVQIVHPAPEMTFARKRKGRLGRAVDWFRGIAPAEVVAEYQSTLLQDAYLVEVEYLDAEDTPRRACLADVIPARAMDRFRAGTEIEVHVFEKPRARLQAEGVPGSPAPARCLLTERYDDVPRAGFDLDGVRVRTERERWSSERIGSPILGAMKFKTELDPFGGEVSGTRVSFPGDPQSIWTGTSSISTLERPRAVPRPESAEEVAVWEDPDGFGKTELIYAPLFWVCLPLAAIGFLTHQAITDPTGSGWNKSFFGEHEDAWPTSFLWLVWIGATVWLLIAIGVLVFRAFILQPETRDEARWIFEHGVPCTIHRAPFDRNDGEGGNWPTFIALDHRLDDRQAWRVHRALQTWIESPEVDASWLDGTISAEQLFGAQAKGGWYLSSIPGFGSAADFAEHQWVLLTEPRDSVNASPTVTTVPLQKNRQKICTRLQRKGTR